MNLSQLDSAPDVDLLYWPSCREQISGSKWGLSETAGREIIITSLLGCGEGDEGLCKNIEHWALLLLEMALLRLTCLSRVS